MCLAPHKKKISQAHNFLSISLFPEIVSLLEKKENFSILPYEIQTSEELYRRSGIVVFLLV